MSIPRLDLSQAITLIQEQVNAVGDKESVATAAAGNRITAKPLSAPIDLPPFVNSAMDGYAFAHSNTNQQQPLKIVGKSLAGHPFEGALKPQECIRITTGAALPDSADSVVIQEDAERTGDALQIHEPTAAAANVRVVGHDIRKDALLFAAGKRLNPFNLSWLAANGIAEISVYRKPRVAVLSTGDELVTPGTRLGPGQIFDSNRLLLTQLLQSLPVEVIDSGCIADDPAAIEAALDTAASADLIITSGGVSVGDADFLTEIVARNGSLDLWRLNLKPGKPLALGNYRSARYLGLPGNPVSSAVTFLLVARPLILAISGAAPEPTHFSTAFLTESIRHRAGREEYQRGFQSIIDGQCTVAPTGDQSSNRLGSFRKANCLIRLPKNWDDATAGQQVETLTFDSLL